MTYLYLGLAIAFELLATSMLRATNGFRRLWPTIGVTLGYACAYGALAFALREIPVGIAYSLWTGIGVVVTPLVGWKFYGQRLDATAVVGMTLILAGVLTINLLSGQMHS